MLTFQARQRAPGPTPRAILETVSAIKMVDAHLPTTATTDGRHLVLPRFSQPDPDRQQQLECQSALCYKTHAGFYTR